MATSNLGDINCFKLSYSANLTFLDPEPLVAHCQEVLSGCSHAEYHANLLAVEFILFNKIDQPLTVIYLCFFTSVKLHLTRPVFFSLCPFLRPVHILY